MNNVMTGQVNLITLKCTNCSASLQLSDKLGRFICNYCGTEQLLVNGVDGFFFKRLEDKLDSLEKTTERGNIELALKRLREDLRLKMVQLETIKEEKESAFEVLEGRKDSVVGVFAFLIICQAFILKIDMALRTYTFLQLAVLVGALYQVRLLDSVQKAKAELHKTYKPQLEVVHGEIETLEIKIRKRLRLVDNV